VGTILLGNSLDGMRFEDDLLFCKLDDYLCFGLISKVDLDRKKHTSNSMKKLTCPKFNGASSLFVHANAKRTEENLLVLRHKLG
jgi:hypothetical protein